MTGTRRKARGLALQALYEINSAGHDPAAAVSLLLDKECLSPESTDFIRRLVDGVLHNKEKIDRDIQGFAPTWPMEQMPIVDRNILRIAIFEIMYDSGVPVKVAINEAVELAKRFGAEGSPRFVNGVLGAVSARADEGKLSRQEGEGGG